MNLVILGYGYSAAAIAREIRPMLATLHVTARSAEKVARLRGEGLDALAFDGTALSPTLANALGKATHLVISAPPGEAGQLPSQEGPPRHRGQTLGAVGHHRAQPGAQSAGEHDGFGDSAHARPAADCQANCPWSVNW